MPLSGHWPASAWRRGLTTGHPRAESCFLLLQWPAAGSGGPGASEKRSPGQGGNLKAAPPVSTDARQLARVVRGGVGLQTQRELDGVSLSGRTARSLSGIGSLVRGGSTVPLPQGRASRNCLLLDGPNTARRGPLRLKALSSQVKLGLPTHAPSSPDHTSTPYFAFAPSPIFAKTSFTSTSPRSVA